MRTPFPIASPLTAKKPKKHDGGKEERTATSERGSAREALVDAASVCAISVIMYNAGIS